MCCPGNHKAFDHFEGLGDFFGKYFLFIAGKPAKHVVDLEAAGKVAPYPNPQPREIVLAKHFDDVVQAVVAAPAALGFSRSSTTTRAFSTAIFSWVSQYRKALPLRFM